MSVFRRVRGIVLARREFDTDLLLDFLTKKRVLKVRAKGVLKSKAKLKGAVELFDFSEWEIIEGKNLVLVGAKLIKRPVYLRSSLIKILCLKALAEITLLVAQVDTEKVFWLWLNLLKFLKDIPTEKVDSVFCGFVARLFYIESLVDPAGRLDGFRVEKQFLSSLLQLPYEKLSEKYPKEKFLGFIQIVKQWLSLTGKKSSALDIFINQVGLSKNKKRFKI